MVKLFDILFLDEALSFLKTLKINDYEKIISNIRKSQIRIDKKILKKLNNDIWEFRTLYNGTQYRLFAFWDKTGNTGTFVIATHGFIKKRSKVPDNEIKRAEQIRNDYFKTKKI